MSAPLQMAKAAEPLQGRANVNWRLGDERSLLMTEFWVPVAQEGGRVIYADLRLMGDNHDNREGNIGLGYREVTFFPVLGEGVAGAHGWIDRRITKRGSRFHQFTAGAEWLGKYLDLRLNTYWPLSESKRHEVANSDAQGPVLAGTGIYVDTNDVVLEEPQGGLDFEIGWEAGQTFDFVRDYTDSARIYVGGYHFDGDNTDSVTGWRVRTAIDVTQDIQIGTRFQHDNQRGSQSMLEMTFRFPFGHKRSFRDHGVRARLDEAPERDIDIITGDKIAEAGDRIAVLNQNTKTPQKVFHVDNSAAPGGDGSIETPFDTLADAEAAASDNDVIYVHRGDGTSNNQNSGITLDNTGQQLIGSGSNFLFDQGRFITANGRAPSSQIILPATTAPVLTNTGGDAVSVRADEIKIAGISIDNASADGVDISNADGTVLSNIEITNTGGRGVLAHYDNSGSFDLNINNITTDTTGSRGIFVWTENDAELTSKITDNTISNANHDGILFYHRDDSTAVNIVTGNSLTNNNWVGIRHDSHENTNVTATINNNTSAQNRTGVELNFYDDSVSDITFDDNTVESNDGDGVPVNVYNNAVVTASFSNNVVKDQTSGGEGIEIAAQNFSRFTADFIGNEVSGNSDEGFYIRTDDSNETIVTLTGNTITGNGDHGLMLLNSSSVIIDADLGGGPRGSSGQNRIYGNVDYDVALDLDGNSVSAENNWWGSAAGLQGGDVVLYNGTAIDTTPYLLTDPGL